MRFQISQADPAAMTTEELTAELGSFVALAAEVAERMAVLLAELRQRRQRHPLFMHPVLSFFRQIASGDMSAEAAIRLGNRELIRSVLPLPPTEQERIAAGGAVLAAYDNGVGQIVTEATTIYRMDRPTLRRVFGGGGIRSPEEQAAIIRSEGRLERHGMITVLRDESVLKIGNQKIRPEELRGPLTALGWSLNLARAIGDKAG